MVSKSGASLKDKILSVDKSKLLASVPLRVSVKSSSSTSETDIVVTAVWFSAACTVDAVSIDGASFTASIVTLTSALEVLSPWVIV